MCSISIIHINNNKNVNIYSEILKQIFEDAFGDIPQDDKRTSSGGGVDIATLEILGYGVCGLKPQTFKYTTLGDLFRMVRAKAKWFEMKWGTKKNTYSKKHNEETLKWLEEEKQKDGNNHKKVRTE